MPGPDEDLVLLTEAARAAGRIALRHWKHDPQVWDKGGGHGPVSEADLEVNALLAETLLYARPDYGWLSEETPDTGARLGKARTFIIDPIDGTRAFIAGEESFAHSLAVAENGKITAAVVYLPVRDRLYTASSAEPARCNGLPIHPSGRTGLDGAALLTTKANLVPENWPGGVPEVTRAFRTSLAYRLCLAAEGAFDGMLTLRPTWEWDIAAGALIAASAGARVSDGNGAALRFNAPDPRARGVIVAGPVVHAALIARRSPAAGLG